MKFKTLILAVSIGLTTFVLLLAHADELPAAPHLSTIGTASIDATPDIATITIEVNYVAKNAVDAKQKVDKRIAQYF